MNIIGLDLGSTTLSAIVVDHESGHVATSRTVPARAMLKADVPGAYLQDADALAKQAVELIEELSREFGPIGAIGLDGQMHGILYVDEQGNAVSPFFSWQDGRGALPYAGETYVQRLTRKSGYPMATGFGMTTHYWHVKNRCVPESASAIATIYDYIGMKLTGRAAPLMHTSSAASVGLFDQANQRWDSGALIRSGLDEALLPEVTDGPVLLGETKQGVPVGVCIGDNQASFIGSVRDMPGTVLVNMGTGGQISMLAGRIARLPDVETRPLGEGQGLWVGSTLCAGKAYALLKQFLESCSAIAGEAREIPYEALNRLGMEALSQADGWTSDTRFEGSRRQPTLRASFGGISSASFDATHMIGAVLRGMAGELFALYQQMRDAGAQELTGLVGSGNAIRRNPALKLAFEQAFGLSLSVPVHQEEAAYGAALFGMVCAGKKASLSEAGKLIRYQE